MPLELSRGGADYRDAYKQAAPGGSSYAYDGEMGERAFVAGHVARLADFMDMFMLSNKDKEVVMGGADVQDGEQAGSSSKAGELMAYLAQHDLFEAVPVGEEGPDAADSNKKPNKKQKPSYTVNLKGFPSIPPPKELIVAGARTPFSCWSLCVGARRCLPNAAAHSWQAGAPPTRLARAGSGSDNVFSTMRRVISPHCTNL